MIDAADRPPGSLVSIAYRSARRLPMKECASGEVSVERGLDGDHKGLKFKNRAITILAVEDWQSALAELTDLAGAVPLPWTVRRANLLVRGIRLPRGRGSIITIGCVRLEVTYPTVPCVRMDEAHPGLRRALGPDWRGGVTCRVLTGGRLAAGDPIAIELALPEKIMRLPG